MNPSYDNDPSSSPIQQRAPHQHHQHKLSSSKSPHSTTALQPNSPASGRQRARTESSPRHQHTSSGWLGPYHEQPSPLPGARFPRSPRTPSGHPSSVTLDRGTGVGASGGPASSIGGPDKILEAHKALGSWRTDGVNGSNSSIHVAAGVPDGVGFERREFESKTSDAGIGGGSIEPSASLQSLVESIDDDHVLRLTELTKKRVEHNNPTQKRQRVVSFPAAEVNFQPSEKTLQFSSSCKAYLESRYTQLYQSINAGHPINRLRKLHEILRQIKPVSIPKPAHGRKASVDFGHSRSRRWKSDKYRFVDKVEESSCIWDLDHMEAKAAAQAATEAAAIAKQSVVASSRHGSQHNLESTASPSPQDAGRQQLSSASTDSLGIGKTSLIDTNPSPVIFGNQPQCDSPLTVVDANGISMGLSPSSTFSSIANSHHVNDSTTNSSSLPDRPSPRHQKEGLGESKLRFSESYPSASHGNSTHAIKSVDGGINSNSNGLEPTIPPPEALASKRNSILGIFSIRGKKGGQDSDQLNTHHEIPQFHQLIDLGTTQERRSFDGLHAKPNHGLFNPGRRRQSVMEFGTLSRFMNNTTNNTFSPYGTSLEEGSRTGEYGEVANAGLTDDEFGGHFAPPSQWPQGERMDDSQDESDPATAPHKRLSLRRLKDRMTWKRGPKALSVIQQGEPFQSSSQSIGSGKQSSSDGNKSFGKKVDPALAYLHGPNSGRASASEASSGRNSMESPSRPKQPNIRILSSSSSPVLEAVKTPDGTGVSSPRVGPNTVGSDGRADKSSNLLRNDRSPMIHPASTTDRSPMLNPIRTEKSPMLMPDSTFTGEGPSSNATLVHPDIAKQSTSMESQLLVDVDRIPKRLLERLKARPELSSINWTADTVDLSAMWTSPDPPPTYEEYVGISDAMKSSKLYPSHLDHVDVLEIHLILGIEEPKDLDSKNRASRWDMLELRLDQELAKEEKWIKDVSNWSGSNVNAIERHRQAEISESNVMWTPDENAPQVEEPEIEEGVDESAKDATLGTNGNDTKNRLRPYPALQATSRARKQLRDMSLLNVRDLGGSISSLHSSMAYTFKASVETTRDAVKEMSVYLEECRQRLKQLNDATGERLQKQEPVFEEIVDTFSKVWNDTYFVKLKEVEDEIQVLNVRRVENPWMDMLLIVLSWFIRGLFYIVEGVTIMIIIVRHAWGKAKKGYDVVRNPRREQERLNHGGGQRVEAGTALANGSGGGSEQTSEAVKG